MNIQSLSVVVPNRKCVNDCAFCVSKMHCETYPNQMDDNLPFFDLYLKDYIKRLEFARHNGCNTVMLTGNSEPQQNRKFLTYFGLFMQMMRDPFQWVEMQTTGVMLDTNYLRFLRNHVGVNLISLSISSLDDMENMAIIGCPTNMFFKLNELCSEIKRYDFSLRLSLNLSDVFEKYSPKELLEACKNLGADQVTLRVLYTQSKRTPQGKWVSEHILSPARTQEYAQYIKYTGTVLGRLPYGAIKYSIHGMSTVVDTDCMAKRVQQAENDNIDMNTYKYLILQPNCKLYSSWDDPASLIF